LKLYSQKNQRSGFSIMAEEVIAIDISGRHAMEDGTYFMICAAVEAKITGYSILSVENLVIKKKRYKNAPCLAEILDLVKETVRGMKARVLISEAGEFFNEPEWRIGSVLGKEVRYLESIGERRLQKLAHMITNETRSLLLEEP